MKRRLDEAIDSYLAFAALEKGLAENTLSGYERDLKQFSSFAENRSGTGSLDGIDERVVSDWIYALSDQGISNASLCRKLSSLRMFNAYLLREEWISRSFVELVAGPKLKRKAPDALSVKEMEALLEAPDLSTPMGLRDRAILEMLYSSGLRVSELCEAKLQQFDIANGAVKVYGKGSKERVVPMGFQAVIALSGYLEQGRPHLVKSKTEALASSVTEEALFREKPFGPCSKNTLPKRVSPNRLSPRAPALIRYPSALRRSGSSRHSRIARPRGYLDDSDIHDCRIGAGENRPRGIPSEKQGASDL